MKVKIDNKIYIQEPSEEIMRWARENLKVENPVYFKKERMGFWNGNEPEYLYLYEYRNNILYLPFGCLSTIWKFHPVKEDYIYSIKPVERIEYESRINLYPYQKQAVERAVERKNGILVMPCGSGKTISGLEVIARIGGKALWLTHTQDLLNQSKQRAENVLGQGGYGTITAGKVDVGKTITFATVQTLAKQDLKQFKEMFDVIICDECVPGNTLIATPNGEREIKKLKVGDIVTSFNDSKNITENKRITHIFKNKAHNIVSVELSNGKKIVCTGNHPIYTRKAQWIDAERISNGDYVLQLVRKGNRLVNSFQNKLFSLPQAWLGILWERMFKKRSDKQAGIYGRKTEDNVYYDEENKRTLSRSVCGKNEKKQPYESSGCERDSIEKAERDRTQTQNKRGEWKWNDSTTKNTFGRNCKNEFMWYRRIYNTNKACKKKRFTNLLQSRYCNYRLYDCNRSGRKFSLHFIKERAGQKKRRLFEWVRVESVTVQEQTSDGTFGRLCPDGYVYNIEVEDNNNYFANDILVHNCQHTAGSPTKVTQFYKVMSALSARYKIGLTATPKRADGLEISMFALLGNVIHEVTREEVEHTTCPVKVQTVYTRWSPKGNFYREDGGMDYAKIVEEMVNDEVRFQFVSDWINGIKEPCIVLANRVEYLKRLCENFEGKAICLSGQGQSKKVKEERKAALNALNEGEVDCLFSSYLLSKEGLDVPNLRYVVFATPEHDSTTVIQSAGRVGRKADGKEYGTVIDFVDNFGMYQRWYKERLKYYKEIKAEVLQ